MFRDIVESVILLNDDALPPNFQGKGFFRFFLCLLCLAAGGGIILEWKLRSVDVLNLKQELT